MASATELPPPVLEAAHRRQLGEFVDACKGIDYRGASGCLVVTAVIAAGVSVGAFSLGPVVGPFVGARVLLIVAGIAAVVAVSLVVRTVIGIFARRPEYFLFTDGLVERKGSRLRTVAWPDVQTITVRASAFGSIITRTGFDLQTTQGRRKVLVGVELPDQAAFTAEFERCTSEAGLPIVG